MATGQLQLQQWIAIAFNMTWMWKHWHRTWEKQIGGFIARTFVGTLIFMHLHCWEGTTLVAVQHQHCVQFRVLCLRGHRIFDRTLVLNFRNSAALSQHWLIPRFCRADLGWSSYLVWRIWENCRRISQRILPAIFSAKCSALFLRANPKIHTQNLHRKIAGTPLKFHFFRTQHFSHWFSAYEGDQHWRCRKTSLLFSCLGMKAHPPPWHPFSCQICQQSLCPLWTAPVCDKPIESRRSYISCIGLLVCQRRPTGRISRGEVWFGGCQKKPSKNSS